MNKNEKEELLNALKEAFVPLFEHIEERFDGVDERFDKMDDTINEIKGERVITGYFFEDIRRYQAHTAEDVRILKEDVGILKEDVGVLKEKVSVLRDNLASTNMTIETKILPAIQEIKDSHKQYVKEVREFREDMQWLKDSVEENTALIGAVAKEAGAVLAEKIN